MEMEACTFGQYRPVKKLGQGSFGAVYQGSHVRVAENVAIKLVRAAGRMACKRFATVQDLDAVLVRLPSDIELELRRRYTQFQLSQEPVDSLHLQLLHESKMYKMLQGGGACPCADKFCTGLAIFGGFN